MSAHFHRKTPAEINISFTLALRIYANYSLYDITEGKHCELLVDAHFCRNG